jgi:Rhodopsin-like GPCR transmembrane domain
VQRITGDIQTEVKDLKVAIYDDEALFWNYIMTSEDCGCDCKISSEHAKFVYNVTAVDDLAIPFTFEFDVHEHIRPRFWYVALARCVPGGDDYVPPFTQITEESFEKYYFSAWYSIHMTQADGDELPVQQQGMPTIYGLLALFTGGLALLQMYAARGQLRQSESFHPIMKLLTLVVVLFCLSNTLFFFHFYLY